MKQKKTRKPRPRKTNRKSPETLPKIHVSQTDMENFPVESLKVDPFWAKLYV